MFEIHEELTSDDARRMRSVLRRIVGLFLAALLFAGGVIYATQAWAQGPDRPVLVVAAEALDGGGWRKAVMLATPFDGGHLGLILNRPTPATLAEVFPEHAPSRAVKDPVYLGGPVSRDSLFALTKAEAQPSVRAIELMPGVWLVMDAHAVDEIIERTPNAARYFVGLVWWAPGELEKEIRERAVVVRPADPAKLFLPDTSTLHEELAPKAGQVGT